jgi:hypothetical protein
VASAVAAIVGALTNPYAERVNDAYRHGAQTGLVVRYTVLGALAAWLGDLLWRRAQRHGSLRKALADRGGRALLQAMALAVVVVVAVIPLFVGGYDDADRLRDEHAGFVDGCVHNAPRRYCECLWDRFSRDPASDTVEERDAIRSQVIDLSRPPAALQRAVNGCAKLRIP